MRRWLALIACGFLILACLTGASALEAEQMLREMTLEQKVAQLFFVRLEDITRTERVTEGDARLRNALKRFPVGGVALFDTNIQSAEQLTELTHRLQEYAMETQGMKLLIGVDEEGGSVSRVARKLRLDARQPDMSEIGATGDTSRAREAGERIGGYLSEYGFTLDFAPVADVRMDVPDTEITTRSFGADAALVSEMVAAFVEGLRSRGVGAALKHFPGHGAVRGNTHTAGASSTRTLAEWRACEWLPFRAGIDAGAGMVMVSHQTAVEVDASSPASMSYRIVTELLRGELGFDGVVVTDALRMGAAFGEYGSAEACVRALEAGCDMLLMPASFTNGYEGVLKAVAEGRLTEARIDESVARVLRLKRRLGLIPGESWEEWAVTE